VVFADRCPVVHGVERRDLVHTHGRHLEEARDLVHDADAAEAVLALAKVEQGHNSGLLVLRGVAGDNLLDELLILLRELERDRRVVLGRIAVLQAASAKPLEGRGREKDCTYNHERVAPRRLRNAESSPLSARHLAQGAGGASAKEGYQFRGHCGSACGLEAMSSVEDVNAELDGLAKRPKTQPIRATDL
jgi:hypothetical protein